MRGGASLSGANLTGTQVRGAGFSNITTAQLYSTASYQAHDLTGIVLYDANLAGINLAGQDFTNAFFHSDTLGSPDIQPSDVTKAAR